MTNETFDKLLDLRLKATRDVLASKAKEYAAPADRLHNFKKSAATMRRTPAEACAAFMTKHLTSIFDIVEIVAAGDTVTPLYVDEKIGDAINYLILLEAILKEKEGE